MDVCRVVNLGTMDYLRAWEMQKGLVEEVRVGNRPNTLLIVEHPHVYTLGRRGSWDHVLFDREELGSMGTPVYEVDRGGEATYHGPGQLVAYPILDLRRWGGPLKYVRALEEVMVRSLADYGVAADAPEGATGVWVGGEKIGAIGVKISRGVSFHGLSLNVGVDLDYYRHIVACGAPAGKVTSLHRLLAEPVDVETVAYTLQYQFGRALGFRMVEG